MRTTITLDKDVAAIIERLRTTGDASLKDIINEALREGLKHSGSRRTKRAAFRTSVVDLGRCRIGNIDDVAEVLAIADGESFR